MCKRDPQAYREEFSQQLRHFEASLGVFMLSPQQQSNKEFGELVSFLCAVAPCYSKDLTELPNQLTTLLRQHSHALDPDLRRTLCQSLILLRNRDMLPSTTLLELFFQLFRCPDKGLREMLYSHVVNDIRRLNEHHKNNAVNKTLQNFMYTMLTDDCQIAAKKSLEAMIELYVKKVWNDAKTANVISTACFSPITKIKVAGIKFFLGTDLPNPDEDEDEAKPTEAYKKLLMSTAHRKKTKKAEAQLERALNRLNRKEKQERAVEPYNYSALHHLNDPQGFAEKLFQLLKTCNESFDVKLMMMSLVARLIGVHKVGSERV